MSCKQCYEEHPCLLTFTFYEKLKEKLQNSTFCAVCMKNAEDKTDLSEVFMQEEKKKMVSQCLKTGISNNLSWF